ncbi:MAG: ribosomal RNA small subunit methyltransferase A [Ignavibacteria bacterium]|nr:ribosomal RNA small subunit methyltransferase A [Ignavibacteria bacterium]MBK9183171.1 ribosomal RNA small subunit methyltransferase A [Ignavibacteria bacterium]
MSGFAPRKQFSQNFLTDPRTADKIVQSLGTGPGDVALEIGPGTGVLTQRLLRTPASSILAIDLDPRAIEHLRQQPWAQDKRLVVREGDALKIDPATEWPDIAREHRAVIGNIPYSITSDLLFWALEHHRSTSRVVMMMQREVARRCVAQPRTKEYGVLRVAAWLYSEAKILFHVQPGSFFPRPDVTSSVVRFHLRESPAANVDPIAFMSFVRAAFSMRRKVMSNALQDWGRRMSIDVRTCGEIGGHDLTKTRAEELSPEQLAELYRLLVATVKDPGQ